MTETARKEPKRCEFCGKTTTEKVLARDPWAEDRYKWVCEDADACAKRGRR